MPLKSLARRERVRKSDFCGKFKSVRGQVVRERQFDCRNEDLSGKLACLK